MSLFSRLKDSSSYSNFTLSSACLEYRKAHIRWRELRVECSFSIVASAASCKSLRSTTRSITYQRVIDRLGRAGIQKDKIRVFFMKQSHSAGHMARTWRKLEDPKSHDEALSFMNLLMRFKVRTVRNNLVRYLPSKL